MPSVESSPEAVEQIYADMAARLATVRERAPRPLTLTEKIIYGHLADHISAHFAAMIPNLRIMEMDIDDVPWKGEFVTHQPVITEGHLMVPQRPGWGTDVDEAAVARHPVTW